MEIRQAISFFSLLRRLLLLLFLLFGSNVYAQPPVKSFVVKKGYIYITLSKNIPVNELETFIRHYNLEELDLKSFFKSSRPDSLIKLGWTIVLNNGEMLVLSKSMEPADQLGNPVEKILLAQKRINYGQGASNKEPLYGFNRFIHKYAFAVKDSVVTFFMKDNLQAKQVMLAGTFNNWQPDVLPMIKTDSGWIAFVKLAPGKHYYKFIADGKWTIDKDNELVENDGEGNDNSVYYKTNFVFALKGYAKTKHMLLAGSFNNWNPEEIVMERWGEGWQKQIYLADGTYTYRFIADEQWFTDPFNPDQYPNEFNETNAVICIGKPVVFFLKGNLTAKKVVLKGSFNQWKNYELQMKKTDSGWIFSYVLGHGNYEYTYEVDGSDIADAVTKRKLPNETLIIAPNHTFRLKGFANAKQVCIAGDFNNWSPNGFLMRREGDEWVVEQHLLPGKHVYKFVIDGKWYIDAANELREPNEFGEENSVLWKSE
ncbi:hypothetical protein ESA94_20125 [Lacibacter luteus]|uniref:AMP-activated protein kinase glycogen-binding domain-containing protein n=1 Tax=Lacibacter luteus TaxID=2508719 RepID=A0A4V1M720_9BACT|nr:hypothetical protein [Lacibacter luteus]RXK57829.1 hypothetical protein ESA94_20125 [Lacibacter luteus]